MIALYRGLTRSATPFIQAWLRFRALRGREDPGRIGERFGVAGASRPPGALVWMHGASVGEAVSALGLIEPIRTLRPDISVLVTAGTVSAAAILKARLPGNAIHQYVPVDVPRFVDRFLAHWRPDAALWIESEIWPNLLTATRRSGAAMILVNGRLSPRSLRRWRAAPSAIRRLLRCFDLCMAQSRADAARLAELGATGVICPGNLKHAAPPLPCDPEDLAAMRAAIGDRPVWLAASTHPGEEELIAEVDRRLRATHPALLTILVPRHPVRGDRIARSLGPGSVRRRSRGEKPDESTRIYLADTLGELGLFYRIAPVVFVGGSLVPHGGQNPLEPARLGCAVLHGPHMHNFAEIAAEMGEAGATVTVADADDLATGVSRLLGDPDHRRRISEKGLAFAEARTEILDTVMKALTPYILGIPSQARPRANA